MASRAGEIGSQVGIYGDGRMGCGVWGGEDDGGEDWGGGVEGDDEVDILGDGSRDR